jgi:hypothetical protein
MYQILDNKLINDQCQMSIKINGRIFW